MWTAIIASTCASVHAVIRRRSQVSKFSEEFIDEKKFILVTGDELIVDFGRNGILDVYAYGDVNKHIARKLSLDVPIGSFLHAFDPEAAWEKAKACYIVDEEDFDFTLF
jgi:hypothetical protein